MKVLLVPGNRNVCARLKNTLYINGLVDILAAEGWMRSACVKDVDTARRCLALSLARHTCFARHHGRLRLAD